MSEKKSTTIVIGIIITVIGGIILLLIDYYAFRKEDPFKIIAKESVKDETKKADDEPKLREEIARAKADAYTKAQAEFEEKKRKEGKRKEEIAKAKAEAYAKAQADIEEQKQREEIARAKQEAYAKAEAEAKEAKINTPVSGAVIEITGSGTLKPETGSSGFDLKEIPETPTSFIAGGSWEGWGGTYYIEQVNKRFRVFSRGGTVIFYPDR